MGLSITLYGGSHAQEQVTNTKGIPCFYVCFSFVVVGVFCLLGFCFVSFPWLVCLFERDKEHEAGWVERWGGSGNSWERRKIKIKIYCMKKLNNKR